MFYLPYITKVTFMIVYYCKTPPCNNQKTLKNSNMKKLVAFASVIAIIAMACSKKDSGLNNAKAIVGKWAYVSARVKITSTIPGITPVDSAVTVHAGQYVNLATDGTYTSHTWDDASNSFSNTNGGYYVSGNLMIADGDTATIQSLTGSNLSLYSKFVYNGLSTTYETWENFTK